MINDLSFYQSQFTNVVLTQQEYKKGYNIDSNKDSLYNDYICNQYPDLLSFGRTMTHMYQSIKKKLRNPKIEDNIEQSVKNNLIKGVASHYLKTIWVPGVTRGHHQIPHNLKLIQEDLLGILGYQSLIAINPITGQSIQLCTLDYPESLSCCQTRQLFSGIHSQNKLFIYSLTQQKIVFNQLVIHEELMNSTLFFKQKEQMLISWNCPYIGLLDLQSQKITQQINVPDNTNKVAVDQQENIFVCAMDRPAIFMGDFRDPRSDIVFNGHLENNFAVQFIDENYFATGGEDMTIRIWDKRNNQQSIEVFQTNCDAVGDILYNQQNKQLIALERVGGFQIISLDKEKPFIQLEPFSAYMNGICLNDHENYLYVGCIWADHQGFVVHFKVDNFQNLS